MRCIEIKNKEVMALLNNFSMWFEESGKKEINVQGEPDKNEYYTSEKYFDTIDKEKHVGFPEKAHGIDMGLLGSSVVNFKERIRKVDSDFNAVLGAKHCAVKMYYPKGGYMGWHNNHNASGYNILFSYTKNGKGWFRYRENNSLVTMNDSPGWTAKVGYYGHSGEPDKLYWHCARAYEDRLTLGFIIPDKDFWEMMIEDIKEDQ